MAEIERQLLDTILPAWVASAEAFGDVELPTLFPEEEAVLGRAVARRRHEFATVRACARAALRRLGVPAAPIVPGPGGAPVWPHGAVGSMTHCARYRAAAVALRRDALTIGIDAEPHVPLPDGVLDAITVPAERSWLARLTAQHPDIHWDRLLFTVKEAVYKARFPLTHRRLDFEHVVVEHVLAGHVRTGPVVAGQVVAGGAPEQGVFVARIQPGCLAGHGGAVDDHRLTRFTGRWRVHRGVVASAVAVAATPRAPSA